MSETASSSRISQVGVVMLPVTDIDRAIEFYTEKLGFEKRTDVEFGEADRWVEISPPGAATTIALVPGRGDTTPGTNSRIALNTDDIDATYAELKERGVDVDAEVMRMGGPVPPMFWFRDPDGNSLLVVQTDS